MEKGSFSTMNPEKTLETAIAIAVAAHTGQIGKDGLPYILHPLAVMDKMQTLTGKAIAVLHDTVEDTSVTFSYLRELGFEEKIVVAIDYLTRREGESYETFIVRCSDNEFARQVKVWDLRHNMHLERLIDIKEKDLERVAKYHKALKLLLSLEGGRLWL